MLIKLKVLKTKRVTKETLHSWQEISYRVGSSAIYKNNIFIINITLYTYGVTKYWLGLWNISTTVSSNKISCCISVKKAACVDKELDQFCFWVQKNAVLVIKDDVGNFFWPPYALSCKTEVGIFRLSFPLARVAYQIYYFLIR